jgi:DNA helicase-2/ATP-dependent DNA helicase PcrA
MDSPYVANLHPEQRSAAEYGGPSYAEAGPLLIIAGAGTGKTNT